MLMLALLITGLFGSEAVTTRYKVMLSLFGKIGEAKITVAERGDRDIMIVEDHATGLAAQISGNERDRMVSRGHIKDGFYYSDTFEIYQQNDTTVESNVYVFDHEAKTVTRYQDKNATVSENSFDPIEMRFVTKNHQELTQKSEVLEFYSPYDSLSVVLDFPKLLAKAERVEIKPVGLAKKERKMYISRPQAQALPGLLEEFNYPGIKSIVQLDSMELKSGDEYGVLIGYNARGLIDEVVTKETYFVIGYGRIEKIGESRGSADTFFNE